MLNVRQETLRRWRAQGCGPPWYRRETALGEGGRISYPRREFDEWLASRKTVPNKKIKRKNNYKKLLRACKALIKNSS